MLSLQTPKDIGRKKGTVLFVSFIMCDRLHEMFAINMVPLLMQTDTLRDILVTLSVLEILLIITANRFLFTRFQQDGWWDVSALLSRVFCVDTRTITQMITHVICSICRRLHRRKGVPLSVA